mmetsp:Transcript_46390/g.143182  ORF Transcript_46390/g.143182 Transcript_46390/m.143182 type:complete len:89 (-) Transcript_46390:186-452(-)
MTTKAVARTNETTAEHRGPFSSVSLLSRSKSPFFAAVVIRNAVRHDDPVMIMQNPTAGIQSDAETTKATHGGMNPYPATPASKTVVAI